MNALLDLLNAIFPGLTRQETALFLLVAVNTLIALIVLIVELVRKKHPASRALQHFLIILLCPFLGAVVLLFSYIFFRIGRPHEIDLEDISFRQDRVKTILAPDLEDEINVVPIEEALAVTEKSELRGLVMRVLINDMEMSMSAVSKALNSSDSETSHYSASVLVSALSDFRNSVHNLSDNLRQDPENKESGLLLINSLIRILQLNVLSDFEQRSYIQTLDWAADVVYENDARALSTEQYSDIARLLMSDEAYNQAEKWCDRAMKIWPEEVETWNTSLRLYYSTQDKDRFFNLLNELKNSSVILDQQTLELVRVFS